MTMRMGDWRAVNVEESYQRGLDRALPVWHHREQHSIHVDAPPDRALAAAREVRAADVPFIRVLFRLRGLHPAAGGTLLDAMRKDGFEPLGDDVYVAIGKPWTPGGGLRPATEFAGFTEPGFAKMALDFRAVTERGGSRLETETRVFLTDGAARRRFASYWLVVRPFSGLVRRSWLAAARRRAER
ncbi:MAG: hypothetical protein H0W14_10020 [Actinobacteria bacterium]|nr:hypothetical protein [Actinomycetota bacterium]